MKLDKTSPAYQLRKQMDIPGLKNDQWPIPIHHDKVNVSFGPKNAKADIKQFPVLCADALTFHKVQGTTIPKNSYLQIVSFKHATHASIYTALSRVQNIHQLYLSEPIPFQLARKWKLKSQLKAELNRYKSLHKRWKQDIKIFMDKLND